MEVDTTQGEQVHKSLRSAVLTVFAFAFGVVTGLVGVGPGFLGTVALVYLFGLAASTARSFVTVLILAAAVPAIVMYGWNGDVQWRAALEAAVGTISGAVIGTIILRGRFVQSVGKLFALALIAAAVEMALHAHQATPSGPFRIAFGYALLAGIIAGFLGSISAFPAGKFLVPMLTLFFAVPQRGAQALALSAIIPASLPLLMRHYASAGPVRPQLIQFMLIAALGGVLGAAIAVQLSLSVLAIIFGCFLAVSAAAVFLRRSV